MAPRREGSSPVRPVCRINHSRDYGDRSMLRARKPEAVTKRLKLFMFGPAGVGKTTAAIQFPNSYIIDCERGSENYDKLITESGAAVFQTTDIQEVIAEVKSLLTERHDYRTLVIDPITTIYNDLLDKCETQVGSDFGRHYGAANKTMKRLANLIMSLDMNVVVTAHAKPEYGQNLAKIGKARRDSFPDEDVFEWSYDAIKRRSDVNVLENEASQVRLAAPEQVR